MAKNKAITEKGVDSISSLLINIFLPCAILKSFQGQQNAESISLFIKTIILAIVFFLILFILSVVFANIFLVPKERKNVWIGCSAFSSVLFIGIPIVEALFGPEGLIILVAFNTIGNIFLFGFGESIFCGKLLVNLKSVITNPAIISALIGMVMFFLNINFPNTINSVVNTLASFTSPMSMIINGVLFSSMLSIKLFSNRDALLFCLVRLIIVPVVIYFIFNLFVKDIFLLQIIVLIGCMPSGSMNSVFAEKYTKQGNIASNYIILSTLFSIITIPIIFSFLF